MHDYRLIQAVATVLLEGGFERAARVLHLTQSAVSQRVRALEDQLGTLLVVRATPVRPTREGQRLLLHYLQVTQLEADMAGALGDAGTAAGDGLMTLPVAVNADGLATWFLHALEPLARSERIVLDITVDDQDATHEHLREGRVLGCVSTRAEPMQGCTCQPLGRMDYLCLATPAFRDAMFPDGFTEAAVARAPALLFNRKDGTHQLFLQSVLAHVPRYPVHYVPSSERFVDVLGWGIAYGMAPAMQAKDLVRDGVLVDLMPGKCVPVHLYWHGWQLRTRVTDALARHVVAAAHALLQQD